MAPVPGPFRSATLRRGLPRLRGSTLCVGLCLLAVASLLLSVLHSHFTSSCRSSIAVPAKLESNLVEGIYHLKHDADVLRGERDRLLNITFSNFPLDYTSIHYPSESGPPKPQLFLFVGVFSDGPQVSRRNSVRGAWMTKAERQANALCRFVIYGKESTPALQAEANRHGDVVFTDDQLPVDKYMVRKTMFLFKHALELYDVRFVLKAGDDAFVNVPALVEELKTLCMHAGCKRERVYFGREMRNSEVRSGPGTAAGDDEYMRHTSLKKYMPYMLGGGYVLSADLAQVILGINRQSKDQNLLKLMHAEDVTVGFWLMSVELRRVNHERVFTTNQPCCFERTTRTPGTPQDLRAWFTLTTDVCKSKWLVLHRVVHDDEMVLLGKRAAQCEEVERLKERALFLATLLHNPQQPPVEDGKLVRLTGGSSSSQFVLGSGGGSQGGGGSSSPVASNERLVLATRTPDRLERGEKVEVGLLRLNKNNQWTWDAVDSSAAWNLQAAPRLFWLGISSRYFVFNDMACSARQGVPTSCTVVYDLQLGKRARLLPRPLHSVAADGRKGLSSSMQRLEIARPGFGEPMGQAALDLLMEQKRCPDDDGLWVLDMATGNSRLAVSYQDMFHAAVASDAGERRDAASGLTYAKQAPFPLNVEGACWHWVDNAMFNREANNVVFEYHISNCSSQMAGLRKGGHAWSYTFTADADGSDLWRVPLDVEPGRTLDYGRRGDLLACGPSGMWLVSNRRSLRKLELPGTGGTALISSCRFFRDNERFVALTTLETPQGQQQEVKRKLLVWDRWRDGLQVIGSFSSSAAGRLWGDQRREQDLLWSPSGDSVLFDSTHGGQGWQIYMAGVSEMGASMLSRSRHTSYPWGGSSSSYSIPRQVFIDVGSKTGGSLSRFLKSKWDSPSYSLHCFEPNPEHHQGLERFIRRWRLGDRLELHKEAAWVEDGQVELSTNVEFRPNDIRQTGAHVLMAWLSWLWNGRPSTVDGSMFAPPGAGGRRDKVPAIDFSTWMMRNFDSSDQVVLHLDCAGCEFEVLPRMIADGSIMLVKEIYVKWYDGLREDWTLFPDLYEELFGVLGITFTPTA